MEWEKCEGIAYAVLPTTPDWVPERYCFRKQASLIVLPERPAIEKPKAEYTVVYMAELINRPEFIVRVLGIPIPIPISLHVLC